MSTQQEAIRAYYMCGLEEAAAAEAARTLGMPSNLSEGSGFDNPSWALYRYWLSQDPSFRFAQSSTDLHGKLRELRFRPDVIPLATFGETFVPHLDTRNWARQLAASVYKQSSSIPPMPQARF